MKSIYFALLLALTLPGLTHAATPSSSQASKKSSAFKGGFSSQKASPTSAGRGAPAFGSFGGARSTAQQQSDSALSRRLDQRAAQANALRTLDARRAADRAAADARALRPLPSATAPSSQRHGDGSDGHGTRTAPSPIIVHRQSRNVDDAVTGFVLGRATSNAHANRHRHDGVGQPASTPETAGPVRQRSFISALMRIFAWLAIAAVIGWIVYFTWSVVRRSVAPVKPNYAFER